MSVSTERLSRGPLLQSSLINCREVSFSRKSFVGILRQLPPSMTIAVVPFDAQGEVSLHAEVATYRDIPSHTICVHATQGLHSILIMELVRLVRLSPMHRGSLRDRKENDPTVASWVSLTRTTLNHRVRSTHFYIS